jgi:hypothetical protein
MRNCVEVCLHFSFQLNINKKLIVNKGVPELESGQTGSKPVMLTNYIIPH